MPFTKQEELAKAEEELAAARAELEKAQTFCGLVYDRFKALKEEKMEAAFKEANSTDAIRLLVSEAGFDETKFLYQERNKFARRMGLMAGGYWADTGDASFTMIIRQDRSNIPEIVQALTMLVPYYKTQPEKDRNGFTNRFAGYVLFGCHDPESGANGSFYVAYKPETKEWSLLVKSYGDPRVLFTSSDLEKVLQRAPRRETDHD
jgi:hypothetical protein